MMATWWPKHVVHFDAYMVINILCCADVPFCILYLTLYSTPGCLLWVLSQFFWIVELKRPNSSHRSAFFFFHFLFVVSLTFPSTLKTFLLLTVATLSRFQSPVNYRNRVQHYAQRYRQKVTIIIFRVWNLYNFLAAQGKYMVKLSK